MCGIAGRSADMALLRGAGSIDHRGHQPAQFAGGQESIGRLDQVMLVMLRHGCADRVGAVKLSAGRDKIHEVSAK